MLTMMRVAVVLSGLMMTLRFLTSDALLRKEKKKEILSQPEAALGGIEADTQGPDCRTLVFVEKCTDITDAKRCSDYCTNHGFYQKLNSNHYQCGQGSGNKCKNPSNDLWGTNPKKCKENNCEIGLQTLFPNMKPPLKLLTDQMSRAISRDGKSQLAIWRKEDDAYVVVTSQDEEVGVVEFKPSGYEKGLMPPGAFYDIMHPGNEKQIFVNKTVGTPCQWNDTKKNYLVHRTEPNSWLAMVWDPSEEEKPSEANAMLIPSDAVLDSRAMWCKTADGNKFVWSSKSDDSNVFGVLDSNTPPQWIAIQKDGEWQWFLSAERNSGGTVFEQNTVVVKEASDVHDKEMIVDNGKRYKKVCKIEDSWPTTFRESYFDGDHILFRETGTETWDVVDKIQEKVADGWKGVQETVHERPATGDEYATSTTHAIWIEGEVKTHYVTKIPFNEKLTSTDTDGLFCYDGGDGKGAFVYEPLFKSAFRVGGEIKGV